MRMGRALSGGMDYCVFLFSFFVLGGSEDGIKVRVHIFFPRNEKRIELYIHIGLAQASFPSPDPLGAR